MNDSLLKKNCAPCEGGTSPLSSEEIKSYSAMLPEAWEVIDTIKIEKKFIFKDFKQAMRFVNIVADIAESEGHHPDIYIFYSKVKFTLWTHAISGLSENDFILAAKIMAKYQNFV